MSAIAAGASLMVFLSLGAAAQTPETAGAFWPAIDFHAQLSPKVRLLALAEMKKDHGDGGRLEARDRDAGKPRPGE